MGIITSMRRQKCLYFAKANDGRPDSNGRITYLPPVEIKCRFTLTDALAVNRRDSTTNIEDTPKESSESFFYPDRPVYVEDVVWFGAIKGKQPMTDWVAAGYPVDGSINPLSVEGSVTVKTSKQTPNLRNTEILYKATL